MDPTIRKLTLETIYPYSTVEFIYNVLEKDEDLTRWVLQQAATFGRDPVKVLFHLMWWAMKLGG